VSASVSGSVWTLTSEKPVVNAFSSSSDRYVSPTPRRFVSAGPVHRNRKMNDETSEMPNSAKSIGIAPPKLTRRPRRP